MFKNLSMFLYKYADESVPMFANYFGFDHYLEIFEEHAPVNPDFGQLSRRGVLALDPLIIENAISDLKAFLPITMVTRERVVDKSAVKFEVAQRIEFIRQQESRFVGRKERLTITDEVIFAMLKDAPIREKRTFGIITSFGKILVNATGKAADDYIAYVRELFPDVHLRIVPADLHTYSLKDLSEVPDEELISQFAVQLIDPLTEMMDDGETEKTFKAGKSFSFNQGTEKIVIEHASDSTLGNEILLDRLKTGYVNWLELNHKHVNFRLTNELTLKAIKLNELEYTPENDEETGLSAAYYRFYMNFFLHLFGEVVNAVIDEKEVIGE